MTKKASKSATTKKAFQDALKKKAAEKAASSNALKPDAPVEVASPEVEASPKHNEEAFKKALELLLCTYPADGRNKRSDFSAVLSLLLKLNVDTASTKEISVETEKALNILGFTSSKMDGKESFPILSCICLTDTRRCIPRSVQSMQTSCIIAPLNWKTSPKSSGILSSSTWLARMPPV